MNKITKRLVAGASAAALLVSAVGVDQLADLFTKTSYAEYSSKTARSYGFENLEQDTDGDVYNTGYGLHTNKTATEVGSDGRTFDVNLESWYVGENPVDVATILDASGSMAWTVDTLDPLDITTISGLNAENLKSSYLKNKELLDKYSSVSNDLTKVLLAIQDENGGYLPQEIVDKILIPDENHTDNTKLSYAGYKYYVYEGRSSVSEFVPLGYWDGGSPLNDENLIGYYPFENSLGNKVNGDNASYIKQAATGGEFDKNSTATITPQAVFSDGYLDLSETDQNGNLIIDLCDRFDVEEDITISFDLNCKQLSSTKTPQTPIIYLGDGTNSNYLALMRGRCHDDGGGAQKHLYLFDSGDNKLYHNGGTTADNSALDGNYDKNIKCTLTISKNDGGHYDVTLAVGTKNFTYVTKNVTFDSSELYLIVGGDEILPKGSLKSNKGDKTEEVIDPENLKGDSDKNVSIKNLKISGSNGSDTISETFALNNAAGLTGDTGTVVRYCQQKEIGSSDISLDEQETVVAEPEYSDKALNLTQTAKLGAVLLDAAPKSSSFTLSFKVKKAANDSNPASEANILYMGSIDTSQDYYRIFRASGGSANRFRMRKKGNESDNYVNINSIFANGKDYQIITLVFDENNLKIKQYINGESYEDSSQERKDLPSAINTNNLYLILGGLLDSTYNGSDILIDDLYVFDDALSEAEVSLYFGAGVQCDVDKDKKTHARSVVTNKDGSQEIIDIAQIANGNKRLGQNPNDDERRGWYYVNSASDWADIEGCLESGKQYIGIYDKDKDNGIDNVDDAGRDIATVPSGADNDLKTAINAGNTNTKKFNKAPENERSIRFYVDSQNHLRCFAWSGSTSKDGDIRTFCSLVYEKGYNDDKTEQITKYEALNDALNGFYQNLARESDLSNSAIVRFSTHNLLDGKSGTAAKDALKSLIIKDWTNFSDAYTNGTTNRADYLQNLLEDKDKKDKTSTSTTDSSARPTEIKEYPYVMTGGTYTWTGLKAFYDNMVECKDKTTGYKPYDIANDARDKYLIIFTDGRDNTQNYTVNDDGTTTYNKDYTDATYVDGNKPDSSSDIEYEGQLAEAWADKLKEEGYTIFCVMMAAGSISPTANPSEYDRALTFVTSLAGGKETTSEEAKEYVSVIGAGAEGAVDNVGTAFNNILKKIQQPRNDYTVQDYIDPRFDLVDKDGNLYKLGAGGKITIEKTDGSSTTETVGNIIDSIDKKEEATGLAYTPRESYMVNRKADSSYDDGYNTGDGFGTGYIYYDDVKDMYYLRWTDQIIPMENDAFDTKVGNDDTYLDVWSATIRLKAKEDFIGGNNILTNGNEAGENLVYSDATIENMDKGTNYTLYGFNADQLKDGKIPYREKLEALSGTDRKINAVDAGGVSQAVYGNGIDIPSSGFPRTTVNVRLLPLNANNLNDVIYMGEVVSPTMMLADLENGYMTGSYYLQYLERYAYRVYGDKADSMPLIELLNKWLKIDDKNQEKKTFTIPYIYLPDPEYDENGKLARDTATNKVNIQNSTGASWNGNDIDFADLNLRDVTGFITYTWKRDDDLNGNNTIEDDERESQQYDSSKGIYDITKDYVAKNTKQIKYNLQLKFTPLKETADELDGFTLDPYFIIADPTAGTGGDKFFNIVSGEFAEMTTDGKWTTDYGREDYLQAMIQETRTYEPHVMYDITNNKWKLIEEADKTTALETYEKDDQTTVDKVKGTVTDSGVYDWDKEYKPVAGIEQIEGDKLTDYYTSTPHNVGMADKDGVTITKENGDFKDGYGKDDVYSLVANTTYTKDVVNAALALELVVDGKYLKPGSEINPNDGTEKIFTFEATRQYNDPLDPLPYGGSDNYVDADVFHQTNHTDPNRNYKLTFTVDTNSIPKDPQENQPYTVWAKLTKVEVAEYGFVDTRWQVTGYTPITNPATTENPYLGYEMPNALPIGTYSINSRDNKLSSDSQFKIADATTAGQSNDLYFKYLNADSDTKSYKHGRFPDSVSGVSKSAAESTKDGEYLIWNTSKDNSSKNIAKSKKQDLATNQTVTFYFGTVDVSSNTEENKGESVKDNPETANDYAKDRLGIIMLSVDPNSLTITKEVDNTERTEDLDRVWDFTVTIKTSDSNWYSEHRTDRELSYTLYERDTSGNWNIDKVQNAKVKIENGSGGEHTVTITLSLKHNQKAVFRDLPSGTWQVTEETMSGILYTPHNNANGLGEDEWRYQNSAATNVNTLNPISQVDYVNEFPYELPSTGGSGTVRYLLMGTALISVGAMLFAMLYFDRRKKARK